MRTRLQLVRSTAAPPYIPLSSISQSEGDNGQESGSNLLSIFKLSYCMYMREYILVWRISGETGTVRRSKFWVYLLEEWVIDKYDKYKEKRVSFKYQMSSLKTEPTSTSEFQAPEFRTSEFQLSEFQPHV